MPAAVPVAVLTAALLHAIWNALSHAAVDKAARTVMINLVYTVCGALIACWTPVPEARAWPFLIASALLQAVYQWLLLQAYRLGDFGQMYPIARGTSPWLVALASTLVLGEALPAGQALGVVVISLGLAGLALADGLPGRAQWPALAAALGTGVMIASYTVVDGTGVRDAGTVLGYIGWMFLLQGPVLPLLALARWRDRFGERIRVGWRTGVLGGVLSLAAYGLVVGAQAYGDLASIAALRETSIVIAAVIGVVVFRERLGRWRLVASAVVLGGIAVLELA
ncbi:MULTISPECIES: EamA family transporter [Streptomyces]|uniref:EamA family transporter n=1 Tax=Streptomyces evansiae TaxID=3075535 RepID=A0ABU2QYK9_9ACTN|nr:MULTISPECIES: EamA family transporter [unclassified Streptomyces]MDT0409177.1 EamA family transporter [Streptomyces sp. DSM 41979]MYQ58554.1 EamA family transporter [Streptomyces sp. SID4926]SCD45332.1 EamA-like transporter family protein [Streptomyces sp. TverLS-915]SCD82882.1 EamA-like transporter family protein [Streptomyces sp. DfronAA-171]